MINWLHCFEPVLSTRRQELLVSKTYLISRKRMRVKGLGGLMTSFKGTPLMTEDFLQDSTFYRPYKFLMQSHMCLWGKLEI